MLHGATEKAGWSSYRYLRKGFCFQTLTMLFSVTFFQTSYHSFSYCNALILILGIRAFCSSAEFQVQAFPPKDQHCNGGGESRGPSPQHVKEIFIAATCQTAILADQCMMALGSDVR